MRKLASALLWTVVAALGAFAYGVLATRRGEDVSSAYLVIAALCTYAVAYRFYSKWIAVRALMLDDRRATPCEVQEDGRDFVRTNSWIVFGHHFAAISGPGPLVGPVLAAQFGYLPSALWILIGVALGGAVQDFVILFASIRRGGKSLGQMMRDEVGGFAGMFSLVAILAIIVILLAVLALVIVSALAESPWGVFTVGATVPIAMFMGGWLRWRGSIAALPASVAGVMLLLAAVWGGQWAHTDPSASHALSFTQEQLAWALIAYGFAASVLPVWLLLTPRDYLSTFMKLGTILALAGGVLLTLPALKLPAISRFIDGSGPVVPGKLFPFCFITIACGAVSGFHSLISSGTTPKLIMRESHARPIGYGAMCLESLVAIMALIAACSLDPGVYLGINIKGVGPTPEAVAGDVAAKVKAAGYTVDPAAMTQLAQTVGEKTLYGKTGGAPTLAVGMAGIFGRLTGGRWIDKWYHFAIMFEALFILTTLDAGTRVGRYLLQDLLGRVWKPLADTKSLPSNLFASAAIVAAWGFVLWSGVKNPDGGTKALWPIFGMANQLLAAIALCLATTILLKTGLARRRTGLAGGPALAWVTLAPLAWLVAVTGVAGWQKMFDPSPRIGFGALAHAQAARIAAAQTTLAATPSDPAALATLKSAQITFFNARFDFVITALFLAFVTVLIALSVWEWLRLLTGAKLAELRENPPTWLPASAAAPSGAQALGAAAIILALLRHWCGESDMDRAQALQARHFVAPGVRLLVDVPEVRAAAQSDPGAAYVTAAEWRAGGPRCC